jgi:hypothetical protein
MLSGAADQCIRPLVALGPSTFISQLSLAREPRIVTRHAPGLSLRTCSTIATISLLAVMSPIFWRSTVTDLLYCTNRAALFSHSRFASMGYRENCSGSRVDPRELRIARLRLCSCYDSWPRGKMSSLNQHFSGDLGTLRGCRQSSSNPRSAAQYTASAIRTAISFVGTRPCGGT